MAEASNTPKRPSLLLLVFLVLAGSCLFGNPLKPMREEVSSAETQVEETKETAEETAKPAVEPSAPVAGVDVANLGYKFDEVSARAIIATLGGQEKLSLSAINPSIVPSLSGQTEPVLMYRSMLEACIQCQGKPWKVHNQGRVGSCVGHGYSTGCELVAGTMWKLKKLDKWRYVSAESIYGGSRVEAMGRSRCPGGDGSFGAAAFAWLTKSGGVVWRDEYPELNLNLLIDPEDRYRAWGYWGNGGEQDNGRLDAVAKKNPVIFGALIRNYDELAAALANSYPVIPCSNQGFSNVRDAQGFARPSGTWAHCMVFAAIRFDRPGVLCINSWDAAWITGPKFPEDQPDGSFWIDRKVVESMLNNNGFPDTYTLGDINFEVRKIDHRQGWGVQSGNAAAKGAKAETTLSTAL